MSRAGVPPYATGVPTRAAAVFLALASLTLSPGRAEADTEERVPGTVPEGSDLSLAIGVETGMVIPVADRPLCPDGAECPFGIGLAIGIPFSYRWGQGTGLGFGYEFWVQNGNGVYEATVTQAFTVLIRQTFLLDRSLRPVLRVRGGFLLLGPSFRVDTLGGTAELAFGGEAEISPTTLFTFMLGGQVLRTGAFTTTADDVRRGESGGVNAALVLRLGITFLL